MTSGSALLWGNLRARECHARHDAKSGIDRMYESRPGQAESVVKFDEISAKGVARLP